jgi:hypothetical protein
MACLLVQLFAGRQPDRDALAAATQRYWDDMGATRCAAPSTVGGGGAAAAVPEVRPALCIMWGRSSMWGR